MEIRRFKPQDAAPLSDLIRVNFLQINIMDYDAAEMDRMSEYYDRERVLTLGEQTHLYVACEDDVPIGCGAIAPYHGKETESILLTIFVRPDRHKTGAGRKIMEALENDPYFLRASRVEVHASITACRFYEKLGYTYKDGKKQLNDRRLYPMEKRRVPAG